MNTQDRLIGSKDIAEIICSTPGSIQARFGYLQSQGFPIKKIGGKIMAIESDLRVFVREYFNRF